MASPNRYLVTPSGRFVGTRTLPALGLLGPFLVVPVLAGILVSIGSVLDSALLVVASILLGSGIFIAGLVYAWVGILRGTEGIERATRAWLAGDTQTPIALCQKPLGRVFRADVRTRAFYVLGLCAEANCDFAEAEQLFAIASAQVPTMAASKWQRHGRCLMFSHRAIALVALGRLDEADVVVRSASALYPQLGVTGLFDAFADDEAFGAIGVAAALKNLEPGRDPRALLTLSSAVVLAARGMSREALDLVNRERHVLARGLLPREQALVSNLEGRAQGLLGGGPMRAPGIATTGDPWADRVLAGRG